MVFIQGRRKKMVVLEELGPTLFSFGGMGNGWGALVVFIVFLQFTNGAKVVSIPRQILT